MTMRNEIWIFILLLFVFACRPTAEPDIEAMPSFTEAKGVNAVIEIPAGTNHKIEYKETEGFEVEQVDGKDRIVQYLPYPGNYGFIPGTYMDPKAGGDGDALDILVLSENCKTGTLIAVRPIAALVLRDGGELDTKIIAVPIDPTAQILAINDFTHFITEYQSVQRIIKSWFLNYKGLGEMEFVAWQNERYAEEEIKKWKK